MTGPVVALWRGNHVWQDIPGLMPARHDRHRNPTRWILDGKSRNKPLAMGSNLGPNIVSISHSFYEKYSIVRMICASSVAPAEFQFHSGDCFRDLAREDRDDQRVAAFFPCRRGSQGANAGHTGPADLTDR